VNRARDMAAAPQPSFLARMGDAAATAISGTAQAAESPRRAPTAKEGTYDHMGRCARRQPAGAHIAARPINAEDKPHRSHRHRHHFRHRRAAVWGRERQTIAHRQGYDGRWPGAESIMADGHRQARRGAGIHRSGEGRE